MVRTSKCDRRYGVLIHAKGLLLKDASGACRIGGAYTWRYVVAFDRDTAIAAAIASLRTTPAFMDEIGNQDDALANISAEEVVLANDTENNRDIGIVFYIDSNETS